MQTTRGPCFQMDCYWFLNWKEQNEDDKGNAANGGEKQGDRLSALDWESHQIITAPEKGPAPREPTVWWRDRAQTILTGCDSPSTVQGSEGWAEFYPQILPFPAVWSLGASVSSMLQGRVRMRRESM